MSRLSALHGGHVELESAPGRGSRFTVSLPWRVPAPPDPPPAASPEAWVPAALASAPVPPSILLAEDNPANVDSVRSYLDMKGYRVLVAHDGLAALEMARAERPALIIMDVQMPEMNGLEAIRRLRRDLDPAVAGVPILALTALAMRGDRERRLDAGATAYLSKPVRLRELAETVARLLGTDAA